MMQKLADPETLRNMAIQALGKYVSDFTRRLITRSVRVYSRRCGNNFHHYHEPCRRLRVRLLRCVPSNIAREITVVLIRCVNQTYIELIKIADFKNACDKIAPLVLRSVLHPSVKILDGIPRTSHPTLLDFYKIKHCVLIYKSLPLLRDLTELRLGTARRTYDMNLKVGAFRNTLEKFSSLSCWDRDIETLANNCKLLRCLDISGSFHISDRIADYILQFRHLEELNLCEVHSLSEEGLQHILNGFANVQLSRSLHSLKANEISSTSTVDLMKVSAASSADRPSSPESRSQMLKSFGCSYATVQHIHVIAQFSNLTSLALSNILNCILTPLQKLKHLQKFTLIDSRFILAQDLLIAIGSQLKCLNIVDVFGTDLHFISEKCHSLVCLHLCFHKFEDLWLLRRYQVPDTNRLPIFDFPSVVFLELFVCERSTAEYIVTRFPNLKKLFMRYIFDDTFLVWIHSHKNLQHLKEVFWGDGSVIRFTEKCTYITEFYSDGRTSVHKMQI
jgi:hypothetical protein